MNSIQSFLREGVKSPVQPKTILEVATLLFHRNDFSSSKAFEEHEREVITRVSGLYKEVKDKAPVKEQVFAVARKSSHVHSTTPPPETSEQEQTERDPTTKLIMNMRGVAVAATYLKQKHGIEHLYVCKSLEDFQIEIEKFSRDSKILKASFVICIRGYEPGDIEFEAMHKVTIGAEKIGEKLILAILDSMSAADLGIGSFASVLPYSAKELEQKEIYSGLDLMWYVARSQLDWENTVIAFSNVDRQEGRGCETFSLRDAVCFMKNPSFFSEVKMDSFFTYQNKNMGKAVLKMAVIESLPPEFMKVSQNSSDLECYIEENPLASRPLYTSSQKPVHKLEESLVKHTVLEKQVMGHVLRSVTDENGVVTNRFEEQYGDEDKKVNLLIQKRSLKYHTIVALAFALLPTEELDRQISSTFRATYKSSFEEGQEPKTINDLHRLVRIKSRL